MAAVVYMATNDLTGDRYIGVTGAGLDRRRRRHFSDARCGSRLPFHTAIRKYGEEVFGFSALHEFDDDDLAYVYEAELIAKERPRYNLASGGRGGWSNGRKHTDETKAKMRAAKLGGIGPWRGKKRPPETIEKFRAAKLGKPGNSLGKPKSDETKRKISLAKTGVPATITARALAARRENIKKAIAARSSK